MKSSYREFKELMPKQFSTGPDSATGILFGTICYILDRRIRRAEIRRLRRNCFFGFLCLVYLVAHYIRHMGVL